MRYPFLALIPAALAACAQPVSLEPAPRANAVAIPGDATTAVDAVSGVQVFAAHRAWPGDVRISSAVTPIRVRIVNRSGNRVLVRYSDIRLVGPAGRTYAALPPLRIDATVSEPALSPGYGPVLAPPAVGRGFSVSPLYSPVFPRLSPMPGRFFYDPFYYSRFGSYWRDVELPTTEMLQRALPEGSIAAGGEVEGFLYFQKVDPQVPRVRFRMDVLNAGDGSPMGTIEIPFVVS